MLADYAETGDRDLVRQLRDFTGASMDTLQGLESRVPASARDELLAAVEVVSDIDARARQACPSCGGTGIDQVPPVLLSSAATDRQVVVIPGATVRGLAPARATAAARPPATAAGRRRPASPTDALVDASDGGSGGSGGGSGADPTGPLTDVTDSLTGSGPASNGGGAAAASTSAGSTWTRRSRTPSRTP